MATNAVYYKAGTTISFGSEAGDTAGDWTTESVANGAGRQAALYDQGVLSTARPVFWRYRIYTQAVATPTIALACRLYDLDHALFRACVRMVELAWDKAWEMHTLENLAEFRITFYLQSATATLRVFESIFGTEFVCGDTYTYEGDDDDVWVRITPDMGWELNARDNTQHACAGKRC